MNSVHLPPDEFKTLSQLFAKGSPEAVAKFFDLSRRDINEIYKTDPTSLHPFAWTPLIRACRNLNVAVVRELLKRGAYPNLASRAGFSPMMSVALASSQDNGDKSVACARLLRMAGVCIRNVPSFDKRTLLTRAVKNGSGDLAHYFIQAGADINQRDGHGETPLNVAISRLDKDMAKLLMDSGANPFVVNLNLESSFSIASSNANKDEELLCLVAEWRSDYYENHFKGRRHNYFKMLRQVNPQPQKKTLAVSQNGGWCTGSAHASSESGDKDEQGAIEAGATTSNTSVSAGKGTLTPKETGQAALQAARKLAKRHAPELPVKCPVGKIEIEDERPSPRSKLSRAPPTESPKDGVDVPPKVGDKNNRAVGDGDNSRMWQLACSTLLAATIASLAVTCMNKSKN